MEQIPKTDAGGNPPEGTAVSEQPAPAPSLNIDLSKLPVFLDEKGVATHVGPLSRSLLYELASTGQIQTASLGMGRGKRVYLTASLFAWLERSIAQTKRPNVKSKN